MRNRDKQAANWKPDIEQSVADYNEWYLENAPELWSEARGRAVGRP